MQNLVWSCQHIGGTLCILRVNSKSVTRGRLLSFVKVGASRVSRPIYTLMKGGKKFNISADSPEGWSIAQCKFLCIIVQFWVNNRLAEMYVSKLTLCTGTVVTGWWYCYYPVSGTRPHYEWVGFFCTSHCSKILFKKRMWRAKRLKCNLSGKALGTKISWE